MKKSKYNNEYIDRILLNSNRKIKRIDDFYKTKIKINWQCLICDKIWPAYVDAVLRLKSGCSRCSGNEKLTNEIVDQRLLIFGSKIVRVENIINNSTITKWNCKVCDCVWSTSALSILNNKSGCPRCAGLEKLTNEIVDNRISSRKISRSENIKDCRTCIFWKCEVCMYKWEASPDNIINKNSGCPKCSDRVKITNDEIDFRLIFNNRKLIKLGNIIDSYLENIFWQCIECNYKWENSPFNILNNKNDCPRCSQTEKLTNEIVDQRLKFLSIKRVDDIKNSHTYSKWECLKCKYVWDTSPTNILNKNCGCPKCHKSLGEKTVHNILDKLNLKFKSQHLIYLNEKIKGTRPKRIDFYLQDYNLFIEYNGLQHYQNVYFPTFDF